MKRVLITAGSTAIHIDKVRIISNIFKGRTGNTLSHYFQKSGKYSVDLLTSNKEMFPPPAANKTYSYKTYDELYDKMEELITTENYDIIIHSAAVSDYQVSKVVDKDLNEIDSSKKISSQADEMYIKLVPTRKIIDDIRTLWNFKGTLIKFKLQVGMSDKELIDIATKSMKDSKADMIVANCLEWCNKSAYIITSNRCISVDRKNLSDEIEKFIEE
jgi:phosphopantothenate-cysteine ligase/phosphopantothenoylcysteine decarboxylase/phosphopantothenate--cysteine ligase